MMLLGDRWTADQMEKVGLVNRVARSLPELDVLTAALAAKLAAKSPVVLRLGRDAFYRTEDMTFDEALAYLHSQLTLVTLSEDSQEGVKAFLEKREPDFKGR
jgi:enoyl-CoA hydratase